MALDTVERLLKQANLLSANEQLLLATRLIERVRQVHKPITHKLSILRLCQVANSGVVNRFFRLFGGIGVDNFVVSVNPDVTNTKKLLKIA